MDAGEIGVGETGSSGGDSSLPSFGGLGLGGQRPLEIIAATIVPPAPMRATIRATTIFESMNSLFNKTSYGTLTFSTYRTLYGLNTFSMAFKRAVPSPKVGTSQPPSSFSFHA